jgi:murein DD-endopeptidase MepM/ murein hydrolase activator NlpD
VKARCPEQQVDVLLAHLRQNSLTVAPGQVIAAGDLLGRVGNSGNTSEPHLHVHAIRTGSGDMRDGEPVPFTFANRFLIRNDLTAA